MSCAMHLNSQYVDQSTLGGVATFASLGATTPAVASELLILDDRYGRPLSSHGMQAAAHAILTVNGTCPACSDY